MRHAKIDETRELRAFGTDEPEVYASGQFVGYFRTVLLDARDCDREILMRAYRRLM